MAQLDLANINDDRCPHARIGLIHRLRPRIVSVIPKYRSASRTLRPLIPWPLSNPAFHLPVMSSAESSEPPPPGPLNYILGFLLVGIAWGLTTPFIRRAARTHNPPAHAFLDTPGVKSSWVKSKVYGAFFAVVDLLRNPAYAVPLVINLTGSVWFFLLIGQAGELLV